MHSLERLYHHTQRLTQQVYENLGQYELFQSKYIPIVITLQ